MVVLRICNIILNTCIEKYIYIFWFYVFSRRRRGAAAVLIVFKRSRHTTKLIRVRTAIIVLWVFFFFNVWMHTIIRLYINMYINIVCIYYLMWVVTCVRPIVSYIGYVCYLLCVIFKKKNNKFNSMILYYIKLN